MILYKSNKNDNIQKNEDQTNIDKYRLAANITVYHIILKLILQRIIITNFCGPDSQLEKVQYRILNPHQISKSKKKKEKKLVKKH